MGSGRLRGRGRRFLNRYALFQRPEEPPTRKHDEGDERQHRLMRDVAAEGPWAEKLRSVAREPLSSVRTYYEALKPHASRIDIWHTAYNHVLADAAAIVEWVKGTGLRPFIDPLPVTQRQDFLDIYLERVAAAYPATADGKVLLRFPRLFMVAQV